MIDHVVSSSSAATSVPGAADASGGASPGAGAARGVGERFVQSREQISTTHQQAYLILSLTGNDYFSLDAVGAYVWSLLREPCTLPDLVDRVLERYATDRATCQGDVQRLLAALQHEHLITTC